MSPSASDKCTFVPNQSNDNIQDIEYLNIMDHEMPTSTFLETTQSALLAALAHPARLQILELVRGGEVCVCHIQACLNTRQAYVSQQLNILRQAGLVVARKDGHRVYYRAGSPIVFELLDRSVHLLIELGRMRPDFERSTPFTPESGTCSCPQCNPEIPTTEAAYVG
jgi:ArsR family transcriptional regulator